MTPTDQSEQNMSNQKTSTQKTSDLRQDLRDIMLVMGCLGIIASLFLLLASFFVTLKVTKLAIIGLLLVSSLVFYKGLTPELQRRLRDNAKISLQPLWQKLQSYRQQWVAA